MKRKRELDSYEALPVLFGTFQKIQTVLENTRETATVTQKINYSSIIEDTFVVADHLACRCDQLAVGTTQVTECDADIRIVQF